MKQETQEGSYISVSDNSQIFTWFVDCSALYYQKDGFHHLKELVYANAQGR